MNKKEMVGMNITAAVREAHEALSPTNVKFLEYARKNPGCFRRSQFLDIINWQHQSTRARLHPWPLFVSRRTGDELENASVKVFKLVKSIPRRIFSNDPVRMSRYYGLPLEYVTQCLESTNDEHIQKLVGRGDFIFSKSGLKCLEYNVTSTLGGMGLPFWESLYLENPLIDGFIKSHKLKITNKNLVSIFLDYLLEYSLEHFPGEDEVNIAILLLDRATLESLAEAGVYYNQLYSDCLQRRRLKGNVVFGIKEQFNVRDRHLYYKDKKIHAILEYGVRDVPVEFMTIFKKGNLLMLNGPVGSLMSNKLKLALLSDYVASDLFTAGERETIKKYIPWTRKVVDGSTTYEGEKINMKDFMLANREKLVLKPARGKGGKEVHVGYYTPGSQWEKLVREAFYGGPWVVQERVEFPSLLFQWGENGCTEHYIAWGIFVLGDRYGGVLLRLLPRQNSNGVINTGQGAWSSLVLDVDE